MRFVQLQSPGVLLLPIYGVNCDGALASFLLDVLVNKSGENLRVIYRQHRPPRAQRCSESGRRRRRLTSRRPYRQYLRTHERALLWSSNDKSTLAVMSFQSNSLGLSFFCPLPIDNRRACCCCCFHLSYRLFMGCHLSRPHLSHSSSSSSHFYFCFKAIGQLPYKAEKEREITSVILSS